jgi:hypothetical protein
VCRRVAVSRGDAVHVFREHATVTRRAAKPLGGDERTRWGYANNLGVHEVKIRAAMRLRVRLKVAQIAAAGETAELASVGECARHQCLRFLTQWQHTHTGYMRELYPSGVYLASGHGDVV